MAHVPSTNAVDSLMYDMVCTLTNIIHVVRVLRRYISTIGKEYCTVFKRVFKYFHGTKYFSIYYHRNSKEVKVHGFINSNYTRDINKRWLTSGYIFKVFGGALSWMSRK